MIKNVQRVNMNNKSEKPLKTKFFASVPMMAGMIFMLVMCFSLFLFCVVFQPIRVQIFEKIFRFLIICFFLVFSPVLAFAMTARRWFTVLSLDDKGVKTSLFHFFYRKQMAWEEIAEVRYYERIIPFVLISQNESLLGLEYGEIIKRKDVLQVSLNQKVYKVISKYYSRPIIGLEDKSINDLKLEK